MRNDVSSEKHAFHQGKTSDQAGCHGEEKGEHYRVTGAGVR